MVPRPAADRLDRPHAAPAAGIESGRAFRHRYRKIPVAKDRIRCRFPARPAPTAKPDPSGSPVRMTDGGGFPLLATSAGARPWCSGRQRPSAWPAAQGASSETPLPRSIEVLYRAYPEDVVVPKPYQRLSTPGHGGKTAFGDGAGARPARCHRAGAQAPRAGSGTPDQGGTSPAFRNEKALETWPVGKFSAQSSCPC